MNEIYNDVSHAYEELSHKNYSDIECLKENGNNTASAFIESFQNYEVTVVELSESSREEEFNLQFTRLNLGQLIISGEKLNAMVGDMKNWCFDKLGTHKFLKGTKIPKRRYAWPQLSAQIVSQVFSYEKSKDLEQREFSRVRHLDLQLLFKDYSVINPDENRWLLKLNNVMNVLAAHKSLMGRLRSRSIVLSLVLHAYEIGIDKDSKIAREFLKFAMTFTQQLNRELKKQPDFAREYRFLIDFQRHLTQGSGEKHSIGERSRILHNQFSYWCAQGHLKKDEV